VKSSTLVMRYAVFAALATAANLGAQRVALEATNHPSRLGLALAVGTAVGLVVKYVLDKRWIFGDRSSGARAHARRFGGYTLMGVATTLIFWGMELGFWSIWKTDLMREAGAVLGLAIGYVVKYHLDKRFVFDARLA
jgi:putative flippase GtrA